MVEQERIGHVPVVGKPCIELHLLAWLMSSSFAGGHA